MKYSGTAEKICAKLVPRSDGFESQGQRPKVKVTKDEKTSLALPSLRHPSIVQMVCAR